MRKQFLSILGLLASIISLGSPVYAQTPATTASETENVTLSGNSLVGIEQRSIKQDYRVVFPEGTTENHSRQELTQENQTNRPNVLPLSPEAELIVNEPLVLPNTPIPMENTDYFHGKDKVQLQLNLGE
ncbi:MAG: hypothetical protein VKL59_24080 [Nostocaceae cyanobacterium]|nr:hypothetical protein [Nostocaceae cyanobacterium]